MSCPATGPGARFAAPRLLPMLQRAELLSRRSLTEVCLTNGGSTVGPPRSGKTRKAGTGEGRLVPFGDSCLRAESRCAQCANLGLGSGRVSAAPARIGDVCGGVARLESGSSPTSATCFPFSRIVRCDGARRRRSPQCQDAERRRRTHHGCLRGAHRRVCDHSLSIAQFSSAENVRFDWIKNLNLQVKKGRLIS